MSKKIKSKTSSEPTRSLATEYRPKKLSEVVGQDAAKKVLTQIFANASKKLPGGIALLGNTGCGKTTLARIIAKTLNCATGDACGKCTSCKIMDTDASLHPDFRNANAATDGGKNEIKELVELSHYSPSFKVRVILIDEAHALTPQGKEAMLLDLEEPSPRTVWLIATTEPHKLPATMLNRCQKLLMAPIPTEELAERLVYIAKQEGFKLPNKAATRISEYAGGHARDAISALETVMDQVGGSKKKKFDLGKAIEDAFYNSDEMEQTMIAAAILVSLYEGNMVQAIKYIGKVKDPVGVATKLSYANGFVIYRIIQMKSKDVSSPYYPSPENRLIFESIEPDIKGDKKEQKEKRQAYFKGAVKLTPRIVKLRQDLMSAGIVDPTSIIIANLLG